MKNCTRRAAAVMAAALFSALVTTVPGRAQAGRGVSGLMPVPASVTVQPGRFRVDENLNVAGQGPASPRAFKAAARFLARLSGRTGLVIIGALVLVVALQWLMGRGHT